MRKIRLLLMVAVWATLSITHVHARAVGDRFQGRNLDGTPDGVTYQITSIADGNLTVSIYDTSMTGDVVFPGVTRDSTMVGNVNAYYKVTSIVAKAFETANKAAITSVRFSENFLNLVSSAFFAFPNLTTYYLPASLEKCVNPNNNQHATTTIVLDPGNTNFKVVDNVLYSYDGKTLVWYAAKKPDTTFDVPDGVEMILSTAFAGSFLLQTINIPASCISIANGSFSAACRELNVDTANPNYSSVDGMLCDKSGERLLFVPGGVSEINNSTIKILNTACLSNHVSITKVTFSGVERVEDSAMSECPNLREITFGPSLATVIGCMAWNCGLLQKISIIGDNPKFTTDESDVLYTKDYTQLVMYPTGRYGSYRTHDNTKIIGYGAFVFTPNITQVAITENVEEIMNAGFYNSKVSSISFEGVSKLKRIGNRSFFYARNLKSITLPASLEVIGDFAFSTGDVSIIPVIQEVYIKAGSKLSSIGANAFANCPYLRTFKFMGAPASSAGSLTIGTRAFANTKLTTFEFPKNIVTIGESAFNGCTEMHTVEFKEPSQIQRIGFAAFQNCGLTSITFPESVRRIENEAFNSCQLLETVEIPEYVNFIGAQAFLFCGKLQAINVDKRNANYSSLDGMLVTKDKKTLLMFPAGKASPGHYTMLSPSFETINDSAFYYNRNLESVTLPKHVKKIGRYTFALCPSLKTINLLGNSVSNVHETAFIDMGGTSRLSSIDLRVRSGEIPIYENSPVWGAANGYSDAFVGNDNAEYFPLSDTEAAIVDVQADVKTFVVPKTVTDTRNNQNKTYNVSLISDYAFEDCMSDELEEVVVPNDVQLSYVGAKAFVKPDGTPYPIKSVFIVNSTPAELVTDKFDLAGLGYDAVDAGQAIHVKKSAEAAFKTAWASVADKISYQIPFSLDYTFSTFAREFDADLSEYSDGNTSSIKQGWPKVVAFTAGEYKTDGKDASGNPMNYVIMQSINTGVQAGAKGDGTYIPAGTGVLLKAIDGAANTSDFYYQIHEDNLGAYGSENLLQGVTVAGRTVQPTSSGFTNFIVSDNQIHKMTRARFFPAHKSYLRIPTSMLSTANGAKLAFFFKGLDDNVVTAIDGSQLTVEGSANGEIYDLQGRKLSASGSLKAGIYVKNGKKVIIK